MGVSRLQEKRYEEAHHLFLKTIDIYTLALGENHTYTASVLNRLGETLYRMKGDERAERAIRKALSILYSHDRVDRAIETDTLKNLGIVLGKREKYDEAEQFLQKALTNCETYMPSHHLLIKICRLELAKLTTKSN